MSEEKRKYLLLDEVKNKKDKLIKEIDLLISNFENETNCSVSELGINRINMSLNTNQSIFSGIEIKVSI